MHMQFTQTLFHKGILVFSIFFALLPGCADMPIIQPPPGEDQPIGEASVVLGPYLTSADGMQPFFRFVTNRRCVAGIQSLSSNQRYVNRQGSFSLFHSLSVPELQAHTLKRYQLWLDDRNGGVYSMKGLPRSGQATSIGFAGAMTDPYLLAQTGNSLRNLAPDAVLFTTRPFGGSLPQQPSDWETLFFHPLGDKISLGPLWFAPGQGMPEELFPEHQDEGGYWRRDVGALRIIGIDARAFNYDSSREAVMTRLDRDLDPSHSRRAWTIVVLSRTAFDARIGDGRILSALGDRLENGGVDLVIGNGPYYLRTRPFASMTGGQTRYITMSENPTPPADGMEPREYVAAISGTPHVARLWADEGTLEWQLFDLQGNSLDILTLDSRRPVVETPLSKMDVISDAQATLTLQREILKITRQAARAVPEPNREILLPLYFGNPTTRRFSGELRWEIPAGSGWQIEPTVMPFDLQPGQGAAARFAVIAGAENALPMLTAQAIDVGSSQQHLLVTREMRYDVYPVPEPVRLDARFRDKTYWKTLPVLTGFRKADNTMPANPTEARITADREGLIIAVSMAATSPSAADPSAANPEEHRDGPVLDDESLEIFIDPSRRGRDFYHFALNTRNVVLDESSRDGLAYNPTWRHVVRFGRIDQLETWDAEIRIPWEALELPGPPEPNTEWGIQLVRRDFSSSRTSGQRRGGRVTMQPPEISQWVTTRGDNTRPGLYGVLRFGDLSQAPEAGDSGRAAPAPGVLIRGGTQLPGRLPGFLPPAPVPEPPAPDL